MVGRSKPQKKMEPNITMDFNSAENTYLKAKNLALAKALADSKASYTQMVEERDMIQRELFTVSLRCTKLENYIKTIDSASKACMKDIVSSSNHITDILQVTNSAIHLSIGDDSIQTALRGSLFNSNVQSSSGLPNKTQAVKPMIDGHVILRPTINLTRVNEISVEEIRRLQSGLEIPTTNRSSLGNNISGGNRNQVDTGTESFNNNEAEDEYSDAASDILDSTSGINDGLDTVREEREDELTQNLTPETRLSALNTNTSLSIPGGSPPIPLLSGVFRDVRVYLSPMQNVADYLDPRQHVTTERGSSKTHKPSRSHSIHSARSNENVPRSSSNTVAENKRSAVSNSGAQKQTINTSTSSASLEESFVTTLQNSLLSSTKISTPKPMRASASKPEDLNWLNIPNTYANSISNRSGFATSNGFANSTGSKSLSVKERHTDNSFSRKDLSRPSYSLSKNMSSTADYDPLEGPSTMLDSFGNETRKKIETMSGLGLTPTVLDKSKQSPPASPARTRLQRRECRKSDEKVKKNSNVTNRKVIEKKKSGVVSTKVAKVLIKKLSLSKRLSGSPQKKTSSGSPQERNSLEVSEKRHSLDTSQKTDSVSNRERKHSDFGDKSISSVNSASSASLTSSSVRSSSIEKPHPKKRIRPSKKEMFEFREKQKSEAPVSPKKKMGRPKRALAQGSFKEPSLRRKMRRSK